MRSLHSQSDRKLDLASRSRGFRYRDSAAGNGFRMAALWKRRADAPDSTALAAAWIIGGAARGLATFADEYETPRPAACWPEGSILQELLASARTAIMHLY